MFDGSLDGKLVQLALEYRRTFTVPPLGAAELERVYWSRYRLGPLYPSIGVVGPVLDELAGSAGSSAASMKAAGATQLQRRRARVPVAWTRELAAAFNESGPAAMLCAPRMRSLWSGRAVGFAQRAPFARRRHFRFESVESLVGDAVRLDRALEMRAEQRHAAPSRPAGGDARLRLVQETCYPQAHHAFAVVLDSDSDVDGTLATVLERCSLRDVTSIAGWQRELLVTVLALFLAGVPPVFIAGGSRIGEQLAAVRPHARVVGVATRSHSDAHELVHRVR